MQVLLIFTAAILYSNKVLKINIQAMNDFDTA